jgi:hypothetical protein
MRSFKSSNALCKGSNRILQVLKFVPALTENRQFVVQIKAIENDDLMRPLPS